MVLFIVFIGETFVHIEHKSTISPVDYYKRAIWRGVYSILHSSSNCRIVSGQNRSSRLPVPFSGG